MSISCEAARLENEKVISPLPFTRISDQAGHIVKIDVLSMTSEIPRDMGYLRPAVPQTGYRMEVVPTYIPNTPVLQALLARRIVSCYRCLPHQPHLTHPLTPPSDTAPASPNDNVPDPQTHHPLPLPKRPHPRSPLRNHVALRPPPPGPLPRLVQQRARPHPPAPPLHRKRLPLPGD